MTKKINFADYELSLIMYALDFINKDTKSELEGGCEDKENKERNEFVFDLTNELMSKIKMGVTEFSSVEIYMIEQAVETVSNISKNKTKKMLEEREKDPEKWDDFDYRVDSVLGKINFTNSLYEALEDIQKEHPELEVSVGF